MRYSSRFIIALVVAIFLGRPTAMMQQENNQVLVNNANDAIPSTYISTSARHKLMLSASDVQTYNELLSRNAIAEEIDYGSFKMVIVDEKTIGRNELQALATVRD